MEVNVLALIRTKYNTLSSTQKGVADYVLSQADKVMFCSLADLAAACKVSEATIIRFLHKLDYTSYQVFRVNIAQELSKGTNNEVYNEVSEKDGMTEIMNKVIQSTVRSITDSSQTINPDHLSSLCDHIVAANRILIIGVGATSAIAFDFYHKLIKLGLNAVFCNDPHMINISCQNMSEQTLLIAISHSGESREILDGVDLALNQHCPVDCITSYPNSSLAKMSHCVLLSSSLETHFRSDAMTSRIIQLCIIDMIYIRLAMQIGEGAIEHINLSRVAVARNKT